VGFAPKPWDTVLLRGQRAGYSADELIAAGLVKRSAKGGSPYDHFRGRITFPIRDARGHVQGFGARAMEPGEKAKYINSPEGELYRKSRTLFGIDLARASIVKRGRVVVVEGYTDVLAAHQAGITETVAVMGTAITPEQLKLLMDDAERGSNATISVDLAAQTIKGPDGGTIHFDIDPARKHTLLEGLDDIAATMKEGAEISAYEQKVNTSRPWI
jgi:DNA primase catalytic core